MKSYFITLKNNSNKYVSILQLKSHMRLAIENLGGDWYCHSGYELDSINRMHAHTMVCYLNTISMKSKVDKFSNLCLDNSWIIHFKEVDAGDEPVAYHYALKEAVPQIKEQISYEHFIQKQLQTLRIV